MSEDCQELCVRIDPVSCGFTKNDHVAVTGDFDNWMPGQYVLHFDPSTGYFMVHLPYDGESETFVCKFVINHQIWRALDCFEKYVDELGHENNLIYCKAWLETEEIVADIVMEDIELDLKPLRSSMSPSELGMEQLNLNSQNNDNEYIHVTSRGELSSSEDVELDPRVTQDGIDDILDNETVTETKPNAESSKAVHGFIAAFRRATTYWKR